MRCQNLALPIVPAPQFTYPKYTAPEPSVMKLSTQEAIGQASIRLAAKEWSPMEKTPDGSDNTLKHH